MCVAEKGAKEVYWAGAKLHGVNAVVHSPPYSIYSEDEVPLNVEGQSYSVKVTMQGNADPLQLILADLLVR